MQISLVELWPYLSLTPTEINICNMIQSGLRTKEIAEMRGVSAATINRHREHIRRKLKITNSEVNLMTYLQSSMENSYLLKTRYSSRKFFDMRQVRHR
jgi:DNA-binding CsgD family transcriptional regulator